MKELKVATSSLRLISHRENRSKGNIGEILAVRYLKKNGFSILERNFSPKTNFQGGEIDIIAEKGGMTHFIEVKMRSSADFGYGRESVTARKQKTIRRLAERYLVSRGIYQTASCCFDVIEINGTYANHTIELFENCF